MSLKIRLRQQGRRNRAVFRLVLTESRSPRDGKYLEMLGWYNPFEEGEQKSALQEDRIEHWLHQGAIPSERAVSLLRKSAPRLLNAYVQKNQARRLRICEKKRESRKKQKTA